MVDTHTSLPSRRELEASRTPHSARIVVGEGVALDDAITFDDDAIAVERERAARVVPFLAHCSKQYSAFGIAQSMTPSRLHWASVRML